MTTAVADAAATEATQPKVKPKAYKRLGRSSVAYFPKTLQRNSDGEDFTAHDFALSVSYTDADGQTKYIEMTIKRREALNMAHCLINVHSQSYEVSGDTEEE